jgi:hypothetical protein
MKLSRLKKIPTFAFIIGGGVLIFYCWVAAFVLHSKQADLYGYLLLCYASAVMIYIGITEKKESGPSGWKFRFIFIGIIGVVGGLGAVLNYFFG